MHVLITGVNENKGTDQKISLVFKCKSIDTNKLVDFSFPQLGPFVDSKHEKIAVSIIHLTNIGFY